MTTVDYRAVMFQMIRQFNELRQLAAGLNVPPVVEQIDSAIAKLESQKFVVAVVGEFKRGKSTFINALLGRAVLPADVLPTSATINRVTYGEKSVEIYFRTLPGEAERVETISVDALIDYVTKLTPEAEALAATVREAVVYFPAPYCKLYNTDIVDTPGLGDEATMTEVTMEVLPRVDATVMVVMATAPFSETESRFLWELLERGLPLPLFVINAIDRVGEAQRARLIENITGRIQVSVQRYAEDKFGLDTAAYAHFMQNYTPLQVFPLSSYQALEGKTTNNADLLADSGFHHFEAALEKYLAEESASIVLHARIREMTQIIDQMRRRLQTRIDDLKLRRASLHTLENQLVSLLQFTLHSGQSELQQISELQHRIEAMVRPVIDQLARDLKSGLHKTLNNTSIIQEDWKQAELSGSFQSIQQMLLNAFDAETAAIVEQIIEQTSASVRLLLADAITSRAGFFYLHDRVGEHLSNQGYSQRSQPAYALSEQLGLYPPGSHSPQDKIVIDQAALSQALGLAELHLIYTNAITTAQKALPAGGNRLTQFARSAIGLPAFRINLTSELTKVVDQYRVQDGLIVAVTAVLMRPLTELKTVLNTALQAVQADIINMHGQQMRVAGLMEREAADLLDQQHQLEAIADTLLKIAPAQPAGQQDV